MNCYLLLFILALIVNNTFDEREAESEGTELAQLYDILTIMAKVHACYVLLSLGFISYFIMMNPEKQNHYLIKQNSSFSHLNQH